MKQGGTRFGGLGEESRCVNRVTEFTIPHPVVIRFKVDHLQIEGAGVRSTDYLL